jgi:hypothetical protein
MSIFSTPVTLTFANLRPEKHYRISLIATSEDPSQYQKVSPLAFLEIDTLKSYGFILSTLLVIWIY